MQPRPEDRHPVDFQVFLSWQERNGVVRRIPGRCVNLSASGAKLETRDKMEMRTTVLVHSEQFGRMGMASIRYCRRQGMKYEVGIEFSVAFVLSDPVRKSVLDKVLRSEPALRA